jgi:hypothetical protein
MCASVVRVADGCDSSCDELYPYRTSLCHVECIISNITARNSSIFCVFKQRYLFAIDSFCIHTYLSSSFKWQCSSIPVFTFFYVPHFSNTKSIQSKSSSCPSIGMPLSNQEIIEKYADITKLVGDTLSGLHATLVLQHHKIIVYKFTNKENNHHGLNQVPRGTHKRYKSIQFGSQMQFGYILCIHKEM